MNVVKYSEKEDNSLDLKQKNKKIVKYKRFSFINIGTVLFGIIFIYMVICLIIYKTSPHISTYEVTAGSLSGNFRYTAIALKSEIVVTAEHPGTIHYYARDGSKVGKGNNVCSIDESGKTTEAVLKSTEGSEMDNKVLSKLRNSMASYASNYSDISYQNVYNFKADMQSTILDQTSEKELSNLEELDTNNSLSSLIDLYAAPHEGIVVYSIDGFEETTVDNIKSEDFEQKNYQKQNLRLNDMVTGQDPIYKILTDESWSLIIPIDNKIVTELADVSNVRFRFLKDDTTFTGNFTIFQKEGTYFGKIEINNSLIRFASDRFIDIELLLNRKTGLKIPGSAIVEREFYKIPKEYVTYDESNPNEAGILRETYAKDGSAIIKHITATVYDETDSYFLVDTSLFEEGDYVLMKDSTKKIQVMETEKLQGVYNINKGYTMFREITVIDENEEYCIIEEGSTFGLSQYDHIALDASAVNDEEIIY